MRRKKQLLITLIITSIIMIVCTACGGSGEENQEKLNTSNATTNVVQDNENVDTPGAATEVVQDNDNMNTSNATTDTVQGNTNANLTNGGKVAAQGDWLYFSGHDGLYKSKIDGSQQQKLADGYQSSPVYWINVVDDWVYFASIGLYKVKTDGSEYQRIDTEDVRGVHVIDDRIYYGSEYRMKTDGSDKEQLHTRNRAAGYTTNIVDDWIYFTNKDEGNENAIFKMKTDGSDIEKIYSGRTDYMIVDGNWIYYVKYEDNSLYKMNTNGADEQLILEGRVSSLHVVGDWIYYRGYYNDELSLNKIKVDGSNKQMISSDNAVNIQIINDWIYYQINNDSTDTIYKIKIDGSNKQIFYNAPEEEKPEIEDKEHNQVKSEQEILDQIQESLESREYEAGENLTKEYSATALSENNLESSNPEGAWVYKLEIKDNNLIVWGSLDYKLKNSSETELLKDQKRTFKLDDHIDLGLDWVGNRDEQIKYFNDNGKNLNAQSFFFQTINDKVTYITFAG